MRSATTNGRDVARIQMDFMFVGAEGTFVDEPRAKATFLMVICKDDGNLSATEVLSTYEGVEIKTDGEPSIVEIARRVQARRDKTTTLAQTSVGGHQEIGAVECKWNSAGSVAGVLPGCARTHEK